MISRSELVPCDGDEPAPEPPDDAPDDTTDDAPGPAADDAQAEAPTAAPRKRKQPVGAGKAPAKRKKTA